MMDNRQPQQIISSRRKNYAAVIGFILALAGFISCGLTIVPAFVLCIIGVRHERHKKLAWIGLVVSCVGFCILLLTCILLISLMSFLVRSFNNEPSKYGVDTRWQKYTVIRESPSKEIVLLPSPLSSLRFALSADRQRGLYASLCTSPDTWAIHLIDLNDGNNLLTLEGHPDSVQSLSFSPDGQKAISGGADGTVRLWDLSNDEQIACVKAHTKYVRRVAYSPVEEKALSGGSLGEILLWDMEKMQVIKRFTGHASNIRASLAWAQDGKTFLSGSWDGSVRLWSVESGKEIAHLQPGYGRVMSLALSPDGKYALSSYLNGPDQPVIFWNLEIQKEINRFGVPGNPWYADQQLHVASVAFSPDGKTALFGLVFGTVIWWDLNEWRQIAMNRLHENELAFVAYSADGKSCISVGTDTDTYTENAKVKFCQLSSFQSIELPPKTIKLAIDDETSIDLVYIEPGSFIMGRDTGWGEKIFALISHYFIVGKYPDEGPSRKVKITKGFYIGKYEVTTRQFCKFLNAIPNPEDYVQLNKFARIEIKDEAYVPKPGWENCQISVVHWRGGVAFCQWLSRRTGLTVRLPTEAEWEYVARSPISKRYPWGETGEDPNKLSTREAHGVIGMPGWIGEWCSDIYGARYLKDDLIDPQGPREEDLPISGSFLIAPIKGKYHVLRRGRGVRSRTFGDEVRESGIYGFRIVVVHPEDG